MSLITPERLRRARRAVGFSLAGLAVYVVALMFCFPYDRAREAAVAAAAKAGYDVEIGAAGPSFPFAITFEGIRVRSRAAAAQSAKPMQLRLDSVRVALLPIILSGGEALDVVAHGLGGQVEFRGKMPKKGAFEIHVTASDLAMTQIPGVRESFNLPLGGTLGLTASIESATGKMTDAHGEIEVRCAACTVGDGKTAAKLGSNAFLAAGLTLPRVRLGDVAARLVIEKGVARAQGIAVKSPDAELTLDGDVTLRDPIAYSSLNLYLRFKLGEPLLKAAPMIGSVLQMAGAAGLRSDGFYGLRIIGTFAAPNASLSPTSPAASPSSPPRGGAHASTAPGNSAAPHVSPILVRPTPTPPPPAPTPPPAPPTSMVPPPSMPSPPIGPPQHMNPASPPATDPVVAAPGRMGGPPLAEVVRGTLVANMGGAPGRGGTNASGVGAAGGETGIDGQTSAPGQQPSQPPSPGEPVVPGAPPTVPPPPGEEPQPPPEPNQ